MTNQKKILSLNTYLRHIASDPGRIRDAILLVATCAGVVTAGLNFFVALRLTPLETRVNAVEQRTAKIDAIDLGVVELQTHREDDVLRLSRIESKIDKLFEIK